MSATHSDSSIDMARRIAPPMVPFHAEYLSAEGINPCERRSAQECLDDLARMEETGVPVSDEKVQACFLHLVAYMCGPPPLPLDDWLADIAAKLGTRAYRYAEGLATVLAHSIVFGDMKNAPHVDEGSLMAYLLGYEVETRLGKKIIADLRIPSRPLPSFSELRDHQDTFVPLTAAKVRFVFAVTCHGSRVRDALADKILARCEFGDYDRKELEEDKEHHPKLHGFREAMRAAIARDEIRHKRTKRAQVEAAHTKIGAARAA